MAAALFRHAPERDSSLTTIDPVPGHDCDYLRAARRGVLEALSCRRRKKPPRKSQERAPIGAIASSAREGPGAVFAKRRAKSRQSFG
jgi:hypothetical protein